MKREQKRMRAGVVGTGHMGQYHILVYAEQWDVDPVPNLAPRQFF